jgi:hypothetical protein
MNWQAIETNISFHDPLSSFAFRTNERGIEVDFRDWRDRLICFHFQRVLHFHYSLVCPVPDFPGDGFYRIEKSPLISFLWECRVLGQTEPASHYIVAHNEDEFCEIVAESHRITIDDMDA